MPKPRRFLVGACSLAAATAIAAAPALGALPSSFVWGTSFSSGSERTDYTPLYTTHGACSVSITGGSAYYAWKSSASDGQSTRCYPDQIFNDYFNGFRMAGRFYADVKPSQVTSGSTFSLATFKLNRGTTWDRVLTLNLHVSSNGPTGGKTSLFLYHTTAQGSGTQTTVSSMEFPLRTWVAVNVSMSPSGDIEVAQNGQVVLRAHRSDGGGQVDGVHFGGYASASITGWTIGNDDLSMRSYSASPVTLSAGGGAPAPAPSFSPGPSTVLPLQIGRVRLQDLKLGARLRNGRVSVGVGLTPERDARASVSLSRLDMPNRIATKSGVAPGGRRTIVPVSLSSPAGAKIVPLKITIRLRSGDAKGVVTKKIAVVRHGNRAKVILL